MWMIRINGSIQSAIVRDVGQVGGNPKIHEVATVWDMAVGDYAELNISQTSGGNLNVLAGESFSPEFMMHRIG